MDALGGVRGERHALLVEERPDPVLHDRQLQLPHHLGEFTLARVPHRGRGGIVQGRLDVQGGERRGAMGGGDGLGQQPFTVRLQRYERAPDPRRDLLDQRIRQCLDPDPPAGPYQRGERARDGLPCVPGEEELLRVGPPPRSGQQPGDGLARGGGPGGGHRTGHLPQHIGPQQRHESAGQQLRLPFHGRVVELQVDGRRGRRLGEGPPRRHRRRPYEGAAPDLPDDEAPPHQLPVHAPGGGPRDAPPPGEHPLRRQPFTGLQPPRDDLLGQPVGDPPIVLHAHPSLDCTEGKDLIAPRSSRNLGS